MFMILAPSAALLAVAAAPLPQGFSLPQSFDFNTTSSQVDMGDLDGDGLADLVEGVVSLGSTREVRFRWARNLGNGRFGALTFGTSADPVLNFDLRCDPQVLDLDGDGFNDVLTTFASPFSGGSFCWFRGTGGGVFEAGRTILQDNQRPFQSRVVDVDGDGDLDVVASYPSNGASWIENLGGSPTSFAAQVPIASFGAAGVGFTVQAADLDGDGDADLAALVGANGELHVSLNGGGAGFGPLVTQPVPGATRTILTAADVDGDGDLDLLSTLENQDQVTWYVNDGTGSFGSRTLVGPTEPRPFWIYTGDVDRDGILDLQYATLANPTRTWWFRGLGGGNFEPSQVLFANTGASELGFADLDGDGQLEPWANGLVADPLFSIGAAVTWISTQGPPSSWTTRTVGTPYRLFMRSAPLDVDGDGDLDIACSTLSGVSIQINGPVAGQFSERRIIYSDDEGGRVPLPADVDGDGDVDILISLILPSGLQGLHLTLNDGTGQFGPMTRIPGTPISFGLGPVIADLEGDGDVDVLLRNEERWFINDGNGNFTSGPNIIPPVSILGLAADVDGDGAVEFVQFEPDPGANGSCVLAVYEVSPAGQHGTPRVLFRFNVPCGNQGTLAAGDLNGDGIIDLTYLDQDTRVVTFAPGLGSGAFGFPVRIVSPNGFHRTTLLLDVDLDGALDLVVSGIDGTGWVRNLGGGLFGPLTPIATGTDFLSVDAAAGDFDLDGDMDILEVSNILLSEARLGAQVCAADAPNSTGRAGVLTAAGSVDVAVDELFLIGSQLPRGSSACSSWAPRRALC